MFVYDLNHLEFIEHLDEQHIQDPDQSNGGQMRKHLTNETVLKDAFSKMFLKR